jgi:N-acetylmuramoyl-L-alanine amidase
VYKNISKSAAKLFLSLFLILSSSRSVLAVEIHVVYPREADTVNISGRDSTFIFGRVKPADAAFWINGIRTRLHPNGAFLAYLPIREGDFVFECLAIASTDSARLKRHLLVPISPKTVSSDSLVIVEDSIIPQKDWKLRPGDLLRVSFQGTPGCTASFSIEGVREDIPMTESPPLQQDYWAEAAFGQAQVPQADSIKGIYAGCYVIQPWDCGDNHRVIFQLLGSAGDTLRIEAPGRLSILDNSFPLIGELVPELTVLRTAQNGGYYYFLPKGVRLSIDGQAGIYYRARLSDQDEAWVESWNVRMLPKGAVPPRSVIRTIRVENMGKKIRVIVFTDARLPFRIEQFTQRQTLCINFFGATAHTDWIKYVSNDPLIKEIRWTQPSTEVYQMRIELDVKQQWGYDAFYNDQNQFVLDIKKPPRIAGWPHSPLKNIFVLLDPGHNPDTGAVGPSGLAEKEANMILAIAVKKKLEGKGALVSLTREEGEGISLAARPRMAAALNPDILLSLHHNAVPDGINPFKNHGTSTYFYHPQSSELAKIIQKRLTEKLKLPDFGLYYDNLALCRPTQMPAVLMEPAFMMYPAEEMLIGTRRYREQVADAIAEALEEFLEKTKEQVK